MAGPETPVIPPPPAAVKVVVTLPVFDSYDYKVPEEMKGTICPGHRVLVPFGSRRVTGFVLRPVDSNSPAIHGVELKELQAVLDDEPLFGPELWSLFQFMSGYYHYPIGLIVAEAMPAGLMVESRKTAYLTESGKLALKTVGLDGDEKDLLLKIERSKKVNISRLGRGDGDLVKIVRRLEAKGWITVETGLTKDRIRQKTETWLSRGPASLYGSHRLGPREKELVRLVEEQGPTAASDLRPNFPALASMIRRLEEKGHLVIETKTVYRDALGRALRFKDAPPVLSPQQDLAVSTIYDALAARLYAPFCLHGVTGSGKTEVYLAAAARTMELGRTVLFLVPEISLTPAFEGLLRARFKEDVAVLHSGLSDGERYDQWLKIRRREVRMVLGARSAIFAPLEDIGLIVVDEEHDSSYKQGDKLRYQARDLAVWRAREAGAVVVLGSATPSLETFRAARTGRYGFLSLTERVGGGTLPKVDIVDMRLEAGNRRPALTPVLKTALTDTLADGKQALLFINRRGLAGLPICLSCGHVQKCCNCSVTLTLHRTPGGNGDDNYLTCHYCGYETHTPERCPECDSKMMRYLGLGTEKLEEAVKKAFPEARVARMDADTTRAKGALTRMLKDLRDRKLDVLVGTQMVTKGHDFPDITLVGVVDADLGLHLPDFRAGERTFQLLSQVAGRAGRSHFPGRVIVQTFSPDHYTLRLAKIHDYHAFFEEEQAQRRELLYPPFSRLVMIGFKGNSEKRTADLIHEAADLGRKMIETGPDRDILIMGPAPAPLAKVKGKYRFQIMLRAVRVSALHSFLNAWLDLVRPRLRGQGVTLTVDVDPYQMM